MLELLEKMILAGAGLAMMTKEKAEKIVDSLIEKGQISAKDKKATLNRLIKGTEKLDNDLEKKVREVSLNVVKNSQKQIDALHKKLAEMEKSLKEQKKKKSGKR